MAFVLGLNGKTFLNTDYSDLIATYHGGGAKPSDAALTTAIGNPNWVLQGNVTDVQINNSLATADVTTRGGNGYRQVLGTLKEGEISFDTIYDTGEALFTAVFQAFETGMLLDMAFADGIVEAAGTGAVFDTDGTTALTPVEGVMYYRAQFSVTDFSIDQSLEEAMRASVTLQSGFSSGTPGFYFVGPQA